MAKQKQEGKKVLIDTCFLIALLDRNSEWFKSAKTYHEYFIKNGIEMCIPSIVVSEFNQLTTIAPLIETQNYRIITFTYNDAIAVGDVAFHLGLTARSYKESAETEKQRAELKDDIKILGQVKFRNFDYIISSDEQILKRCEKLKKSGIVSCSPISIRQSFDSSVFNNGQADLLDGIE